MNIKQLKIFCMSLMFIVVTINVLVAYNSTFKVENDITISTILSFIILLFPAILGLFLMVKIYRSK